MKQMFPVGMSAKGAGKPGFHPLLNQHILRTGMQPLVQRRPMMQNTGEHTIVDERALRMNPRMGQMIKRDNGPSNRGISYAGNDDERFAINSLAMTNSQTPIEATGVDYQNQAIQIRPKESGFMQNVKKMALQAQQSSLGKRKGNKSYELPIQGEMTQKKQHC